VGLSTAALSATAAAPAACAGLASCVAAVCGLHICILRVQGVCADCFGDRMLLLVLAQGLLPRWSDICLGSE
jgi:hypothetical protein